MGLWEGIRASLSLLTRRDRRLLLVAVVAQVLLSILDLVGVVLLGLVGALAITTIQSQPPPEVVGTLADSIGIGGLSDQSLVLVLSGIAAIALLAKSLIAGLLTRRTFLFLANRQALVSSRMATQLFASPLTFVRQRSTQETAYALTGGAGAATTGVLGSAVVFIAESGLLIMLGTVLLIVDPLMTLVAVAFFAAIAILLHHIMGRRASQAGREAGVAEVESLSAIQEALHAYREIVVFGRRYRYVELVHDSRWRAARSSATFQFVSMLPKYVYEGALVLGGLTLAGFLLVTKDAVAAAGSLALFLAASTRIMPSLLRLQTSALVMRGSATQAAPTYELARDLSAESVSHPEASPCGGDHSQHSAPEGGLMIVAKHVVYEYPGAKVPAIADVSFVVPPGESLAIVGPSGSGKTTLADLILGLLPPLRGTLTIGGVPAHLAVLQSPASAAYVPQDVFLANESIAYNIALGVHPKDIDAARVWQVLEQVGLASYVHDHREGLSTMVGEGGVRLSGGQRQRIGIARALYSDPRLLVLDEATSSLDSQTESEITQVIDQTRGTTTLVVIAHRLSTVRSVDQILYLDGGRQRALGSFDDVRRANPDFDEQARLLGIT